MYFIITDTNIKLFLFIYFNLKGIIYFSQLKLIK